MSLITLTFGNGKNNRALAIGRGKVKVLKTDHFFGTEELCVIGKLIEGAVATNMQLDGYDASIKSVESNYGEHTCEKTGAQVVLMVSGLAKDQLNKGDELLFEKNQVEQIQKPKGRLIIA